MLNKETLALAKKLWDYHHTNHTLEKADCILALGSHDLRVAERARIDRARQERDAVGFEPERPAAAVRAHPQGVEV